MDRYFRLLGVLSMCLLGWACHSTSSSHSLLSGSNQRQVDSLSIGARYMQAYPDHIIGYGPNYILWKDSTRFMCDDGITDKSFDALLNTPDLEDVLHFPYPSGLTFDTPAVNMDPGRIRHDGFFKKMYGHTEREVQRSLVPVKWLPKHTNLSLQVTQINGVAAKLQAISHTLDTLPHLHPYLLNPGGSFNWRVIAGTERMSGHSYGFAIDINVKYANYWRWDRSFGTGSIPYLNRIPLEIVEIFERYGFIWGGKWYHYDTMHFEYRPEFFSKASS